MTFNTVLGIDTSNYKTSLALIRGDEIICDLRRFLTVKEGERGLRQSDALFQHVKNLPELMSALRDCSGIQIDGIAFSDRPRPVEGSYMPCFMAGKSLGESLASAFNVPVAAFSHQEGHIEAVIHNSPLKDCDKFIACHFSGGTTEILKVSPAKAYDIEIIGGTKDISFGQVIDRAGVAMGLPFPCGEALDRLALDNPAETDALTPVKVSDARINLSGIDTQIKNCAGTLGKKLAGEIFTKLSEAVVKMIYQACDASSIDKVIMSGGVSSSRFMRQKVLSGMNNKGITVYFDENNLSSDNAVGIAFLGGKHLWD